MSGFSPRRFHHRRNLANSWASPCACTSCGTTQRMATVAEASTAEPAAAEETPAAAPPVTTAPEEPEAPAPAVPAPAALPPITVADMQMPSAEAELALRNGEGTHRRVSIESPIESGAHRVSSPRARVRPNDPPLVKLRRSLASDKSASFGSIRFPARVMPAKFVHLAPDSEPGVVVSLLVDTWKLATPCAVLALSPPSAGPMTPMAPSNKPDDADSRFMLRGRLTPDEVNIKLRRGRGQAC